MSPPRCSSAVPSAATTGEKAEGRKHVAKVHLVLIHNAAMPASHRKLATESLSTDYSTLPTSLALRFHCPMHPYQGSGSVWSKQHKGAHAENHHPLSTLPRVGSFWAGQQKGALAAVHKNVHGQVHVMNVQVIGAQAAADHTPVTDFCPAPIQSVATDGKVRGVRHPLRAMDFRTFRLAC